VQKPSSIAAGTERWPRPDRSVLAILKKSFSIIVLTPSERASNDLVRAPAVIGRNGPGAIAVPTSGIRWFHLTSESLLGVRAREHRQLADHAATLPRREVSVGSGDVAPDMPQLMGVEKRVRTPADRPQPKQTCAEELSVHEGRRPEQADYVLRFAHRSQIGR